jgi:WD40 repeat protein
MPPSRSLPLLAGALALGLLPAARAAAPPTRADGPGGPLPPHARARLGTLAWRGTNTTSTVSFSPDGQRLASGDRDGAVRLWDVARGRELRRWQFGRAFVPTVLFAAGGTTLIVGVQREGVRWLDARTGKVLAHVRGHYAERERLTVSADGKVVATATWDERPVVHFWDAATAKPRGQLRLPHRVLDCLALSPDGKLVATAEGIALVRVWHAASGKEARRMDYSLSEGAKWLSFSGDGKLLGAGTKEEVGVWHVATGKSALPAGRSPPKARFFLFAPDSASVALVQDGGVDLWDLSTTRPLFRTPGITSRDRWPPPAVAFSPDGNRLVTATDREGIQLRDASTGQKAPPREGHTGGGVIVRYLGNGDRLLSWSREDGSYRLWDVPRAKQVEHFSDRRLLGLSADGKTAVMQDGPAAGMVLTGLGGKDAATPRKIEDDGSLKWRPLGEAVFSPDGRDLATLSVFWPGRCLSPLYRLQLSDVRTGKQRWATFTGDGGRPLDGRQPLFSPDGKVLALTARANRASELALLDARTGQSLPLGSDPRGSAVAFSPDGRLLIAGGGPRDFGRPPFEHEPIGVWDLAAGRKVLALPGTPPGVTALALSRNGRHLFLGTQEGPIVIWDLLTNRQVRRLAGHEAAVCSLAVSPDGSELASGSDDTTVLLWGLSRLLAPRPRPVSAARLRALWADLAARDALPAYRAAWALAEADGAVPFLGGRLPPVRPVEKARLARLITDLGSDDFVARDKAEKELATLDDQAMPALRAALRDKPSLELALRASRLLEGLEKHALPPQQALALAVLEDIASPAARRLLRELAAGAPDARLTRHAQAALARLQRRAARAGGP